MKEAMMLMMDTGKPTAPKQSYADVVGYQGITTEEIMELLSKRDTYPVYGSAKGASGAIANALGNNSNNESNTTPLYNVNIFEYTDTIENIRFDERVKYFYGVKREGFFSRIKATLPLGANLEPGQCLGICFIGKQQMVGGVIVFKPEAVHGFFISERTEIVESQKMSWPKFTISM